MSKRLSFADGLNLLRDADFLCLGQLAHAKRLSLNPEKRVTFAVDRNINYTNICSAKCRFCSFHRQSQDSDAFVLSYEAIAEKLRELIKLGGDHVLLQGGLNEDLGLSYFTALFRQIKENFPQIHLHALSPPEVVHLSQGSGLSISQVLQELKEAGLGTIPGGGAEILSGRVRQIISPKKISSEQWLAVMEEAHNLGIRSSATMMLGSIETYEERILHLQHLRDLQDKTGGFTAFIPWVYQPNNNSLGGQTVSSLEYLRTLAVSRLFLDNFDHIQASWVTQGPKIGQLALFWGADDFGSTMLEENVIGVKNILVIDEIACLIKEAGFEPVIRNVTYTSFRTCRIRS